jgi:hypothetical protein
MPCDARVLLDLLTTAAEALEREHHEENTGKVLSGQSDCEVCRLLADLAPLRGRK